ncbi:MAG: fasciclin domain-containing protein, partial [Bacteroidales bacterium]
MKKEISTQFKRFIISLTLILFAFPAAVNAWSPTPSNSIADIIFHSDDHHVLEEAIKAAGIEEDLRGHKEYTVFAPTDAAFHALPEGLLESLLEDPKGKLAEILWYHAIEGSVTTSHFSDGQKFTTVFGKEITINVQDHKFYVNDVEITVKDIHADNGVVHVIDVVLTPPSTTVVDIVVENDHLQVLEEAVKAAGLVEILKGEGPYTIFAPSNNAFHALPEGTLKALLEDPSGDLTNILFYHVLSDKIYSNDLYDGQEVETVLGKNVKVTINEKGVFINDAKVVVKDIKADNGVVHIIDAVLIPEERKTVADIVIESEVHNTLEAALNAAKLVETLKGEGNYTVFAPTDDAFHALPEGLLETLLEDPSGQLKDILLYHVVSGKALSTDLVNGQKIKTLLGEDITVTINEKGVFINDAKVTIADIEAENGVVHVIDAVLIPETMPATVVDIIVNSEVHETLEAAVIAANLVETLQGEGPFTVFAPTDEAFHALPEGTLDALLADPSGDLTDILLYHVVAGKAMSSDLSDGQEIETVLGKNIKVTISKDGVFINNAKVTIADIKAGNGVVHVIDAVLIPEMKPATVVDIIVNSEVHETLEAAVIAANLVETLQGEGP